jgi:hypothetical protein
MDKLKQGQKEKDQQNQQNQHRGGNNQGQNQGGPQRRNQKDRSNKRFQRQDKEWKKIPPKDNEPKQKRVGIKTSHWCIHHMKWTLHKSDDCDLAKKQQDGNQGTNINQNDKPCNLANQATYAELLAQLALLSADD